jgi:hypothetical protein
MFGALIVAVKLFAAAGGLPENRYCGCGAGIWGRHG